MTPLTFDRPSLRLAALALKVHDRMAGTFLPVAGVGEKTIHVVSVGSRERVRNAPDFLEHQVGALIRL
jgi:hypothetical protein